MSETAFDTLVIAHRLQDAGFDDKQAEAVTFAIRDGVTSGVATKADITEVRTELKADIAEVKAELKWLKIIGGAILAVLILPWLAEVLSATMP